MFDSAILEVAAGLVLVFLLVSLICSEIGNKVSEWLNWRARDLEIGIRDSILQGNQDMLAALYYDPLVSSLAPKDSRLVRLLSWLPPSGQLHTGQKPNHIPARTFALALFDAFVPGANSASTVDELMGAIAALPPTSPLRDPLLGLATRGDETIDRARANVENWFDAVMDHVSQKYKRNMWKLALLIGMLTSMVLNVDSIAVANRLWRDSAVRATVARVAEAYAQQPGGSDAALGELNKLDLPIGWEVSLSPNLSLFPKDWMVPPGDPPYLRANLLKVLGWFITAFAGAQGAPFWFDLLRKLTQKE